MTRSSWRCHKKARFTMSVAISMVVMLGGASPAFAREPAQTQYDEAMAQYERGNYDKAMASFEQLLAQSLAGNLAGDAQYMLGQCYVQLERHDDAIFAFYTAAYKYPQGNRADDALMALAGDLHRQGYIPQAVDAYEQLVKEYPQSEHTAYAQTRIGWLHGGVGNTEKAKAAASPPPPPVSSIIDQILLLDSIPPSPSNQKSVFSYGDTLYVWVESKILNTPHKLEIIWTSPSGKEMKREGFDLRGWGAKETFWSGLETGRQMTQGRWRIDLLIDGRIDRAISFLLKP